jgi:DNA-binding transcriptional LysR family regulator
MKLDPLSLKLFVAVIEEGTIADAASREHLAASAVSNRLSELEEALDTRLFARSNKGVKPTPAAFTLLNLARGVLNNLDDIVSQMSQYSTGLRGHIRISANISCITQFLPAELKSFLALHPLVQIQMKEQISSAVAKSVAENATDVGLLNLGTYGQDIELLPYHEDELVVIAPEGHPLVQRKTVMLKDLVEFDFVGAHPGSEINNLLLKAASDMRSTLTLRIQVSSYDAMCLMVANNLGIGVLPRDSAKLYLKPLKLTSISLAEPWARRRLAVAVRSYGTLSIASKQLVDHLKSAG